MSVELTDRTMGAEVKLPELGELVGWTTEFMGHTARGMPRAVIARHLMARYQARYGTADVEIVSRHVETFVDGLRLRNRLGRR